MSGDVFSASADEARSMARKYRERARYAGQRQSGHADGAIQPTRYRHFLMAAVLANEARAELEERIACLYTDAARSWPKGNPDATD